VFPGLIYCPNHSGETQLSSQEDEEVLIAAKRERKGKTEIIFTLLNPFLFRQKISEKLTKFNFDKFVLIIWRHNIQHHDIQYNDTRHNEEKMRHPAQ
jgi:hypothetical protein